MAILPDCRRYRRTITTPAAISRQHISPIAGISTNISISTTIIHSKHPMVVVVRVVVVRVLVLLVLVVRPTALSWLLAMALSTLATPVSRPITVAVVLPVASDQAIRKSVDPWTATMWTAVVRHFNTIVNGCGSCSQSHSHSHTHSHSGIHSPTVDRRC